MEALTAVSCRRLDFVDMCKAQLIQYGDIDIQVLHKVGGKSGFRLREAGCIPESLFLFLGQLRE